MEYPVFEYKGFRLHFAMHQDGNGYFGGLYYYHPTPSGMDRWLPRYTDNRRFENEQDADAAFKKVFGSDLLEAEQNAKTQQS